MNPETTEIIEGLLWCAENFVRELDQRMKDSESDEDYSYNDMGKKQAVEAIEKAKLFIKRRSNKMTRKFKLVIPEKIDKKNAAAAAFHANDEEEIREVNQFTFGVPKSWLIEIKEKSAAEEWIDAFDNTGKLSCCNDPRYVRQGLYDAHEAGQEIGAKNERERFGDLMSAIRAMKDACIRRQLSEMTENIIAAYEKLSQND